MPYLTDMDKQSKQYGKLHELNTTQ